MGGTDLLKRKNWNTEGVTISEVLTIESNWISWNAVCGKLACTV
ncbi:hypothetical protein RE438_31470 (plasmid) [Bacillus wiedmannii]|nr:hypothetical protein [Bacillus wiedmannii]WMS85386.1 hypothetical protein RE438_31470 [Bacillus wiedmannii]